MRKKYFYIFRYSLSFIFYMVLLIMFSALITDGEVIKKTIVQVMIAVMWIPSILFNNACYYGNKIASHPFFKRKRICSFSQIFEIYKLPEKLKTVRLYFSNSDTGNELQKEYIDIEYIFQKKQLIDMLEKIVQENKDVKFLVKCPKRLLKKKIDITALDKEKKWNGENIFSLHPFEEFIRSL